MLRFGYMKMMFAVSPSLDWKSHSSLQSPVLALKFLVQQLECPVLQLSDTGSTTASSEDIKTSLLEIPHVTQPWITLVSFTAASIISSSSQLTGKSLDIGTSLHTTMWFSWVLVVPSPNPHNSSSSILPVPHNLLFWDLFISRSIIMRLVPQLIQEELLEWSSEKEMKTMLITSETVEGKANHQLLFFLLFLFIVTVVIISYKL